MARKRAVNCSGMGGNTANLDFEAKLGLAADKLCNNTDAAEHNDVVLGLIFLKHISATFRNVDHPDLRADCVFSIN